MFDYIWKYKNPKLKKTTIIKNKKEGGLNTLDFTLFDKALKIVWIKRLCPNDERPWKFIPLSFLSNVGGSFLFQSNYDIQYLPPEAYHLGDKLLLPLNENLPKFYRDITSHWQKINNINPKTKGDVLNQIIWNNQLAILSLQCTSHPKSIATEVNIQLSLIVSRFDYSPKRQL